MIELMFNLMFVLIGLLLGIGGTLLIDLFLKYYRSEVNKFDLSEEKRKNFYKNLSEKQKTEFEKVFSVSIR